MNKESRRMFDEAKEISRIWKRIKSSSPYLRDMPKKHAPSEIQKYEL